MPFAPVSSSNDSSVFIITSRPIKPLLNLSADAPSDCSCIALYNMFAARTSEQKRERKLLKVTSNPMHQIVRYSVYIGCIKSHILSCP